jgi:hypothetical protein
MTTLDPDRPPEQIADLPSDPVAATREIRRRMIDEWRVVLRSSGQQLEGSTFGTSYLSAPVSWTATLTVTFTARYQSEWPELDSAVAAAAARAGWTQAGVSHGLNVRKGAFFLKGGCSVGTKCTYQMQTGRQSSVTFAVTDPADSQVPELAEFLARPTTSGT